MNKEFKINGWGTIYECKFSGNKERGVTIVYKDEEFGGAWMPFANFTSENVGCGWSIKNYSENAPWADRILADLLDEEYCKWVGRHSSGFVTMPVVAFTDKFWNELCA